MPVIHSFSRKDEITEGRIDVRDFSVEQRFTLLHRICQNSTNPSKVLQEYSTSFVKFKNSVYAGSRFWFLYVDGLQQELSCTFSSSEPFFEEHKSTEYKFSPSLLEVSGEDNQKSENKIDIGTVVKYLTKQYSKEDAELFLTVMKHLEV